MVGGGGLLVEPEVDASSYFKDFYKKKEFVCLLNSDLFCVGVTFCMQ